MTAQRAVLISSPWFVRTPTVYRYFKEQEYVERFWKTGTIRLASLAEFRKHADETRRDPSDGAIGLELMGAPVSASEADPFYMHSTMRMGKSHYVLCGSVRRRLTKFGEGQIAIVNTTGFAECIARQLPGFECGWEGLCDYGGPKFWSQTVDETVAAAIRADLAAGRAPQLPQMRVDVMFTKSMDFAEELEYRWIWRVDHEVTKEIFVNVPSARLFCINPASNPPKAPDAAPTASSP